MGILHNFHIEANGEVLAFIKGGKYDGKVLKLPMLKFVEMLVIISKPIEVRDAHIERLEEYLH